MIRICRVVLALLCATSVFSSCNTDIKQAKKKVEVEETPVKEPKKIYGFVADSFAVVRMKIPQRSTLSDILSAYNLGENSVFEIAQTSDSVFPVRKMRAGNELCFFLSKDSSRLVKHFVYKVNPLLFVAYSLGDSVVAKEYEMPITVVERKAKGVIKSSLWNAMVDSDISPLVALELSDIYAWSIDFFGLQKDDEFKVVFDEMYVDDTVNVGIREIKYALFKHMDTTFYAIPFDQDSVLSFYDEKGNSLKKAFLKAPLKYSRISSGFSNSRFHPVLKIYRAHHGVDYAAPIGTPVLSIGDGTVVKKGYSGGAGHLIKVKHNSTYTTVYMHLSKYGKDIAVGQRVTQGQVLGYVGSSGLSTGPHLDFRVYKNGGAINPLKLESPPVEPVYDTLMNKFAVVRDSIVAHLQGF